MPVGIVPCQARHFQPHDYARASHADIGHQSLKSLTPGRRRAGLALVAIDDNDLVVAPAERGRTAAKGVLPLRALDVLDDLSHRRLADVEISVPFEMMRLNFEQRVHDVLRSLRVIAIPART